MRFRDFEDHLATIPAWLPVAVAAGSLGYAVYLALLGRTVRKQPVLAQENPVVPPPAAAWPREMDQKYFDSELHLALSYLELARFARVAEDAADCRERALEIYTDLSSWITCHGGQSGFDRELDRLRWLIEALDPPSTDF